MKKILTLILLLTLLCHLLSGCSLLLQSKQQKAEQEDPEYIAKLEELIGLLDELYVDGYNKEDLADYLASAAVSATGDRWSYYINADEFASYQADRDNEYVGIGISVQTEYEDDGILILEVNPSGPAYKAGLMPRDKIVGVDGKTVEDVGPEVLIDMIGGEINTDVVLTILRNGESFDVTVTRSQIETIVVSYELIDTTGYIKITNFHARCAQEGIAAIETLREQGATGFIFDLRYNPGGSLDELVELLDYLLPEGIIFRSVNYKGVEDIIECEDEHSLEMPMCVMVNEDSYSAAEFFAAALQEYGWATVVGTQTVGKGNYQQTYMLSDGSAVAISTGHYSTPNGVNLEGVGITPDIIVEVDDHAYVDIYLNLVDKADDPQLQAALKALQD